MNSAGFPPLVRDANPRNRRFPNIRVWPGHAPVSSRQAVAA
jgi:hypothetical protein